MLEQLDCMQVSTPAQPLSLSVNDLPLSSLLSTLLAHPEFVQGVRDCQEYYFDLYDEAPLTEEEMFKVVEINLSRRTAKADRQTTAILGGEAPSYLEKLGWVFGTIARGLTYAEAQRLTLC